MIGNPFVGTTATGNASLELELNIPITDLERTAVSGAVLLNGNTIKMKNVPELAAAQGRVSFTEKGVWGSSLTANVYGCDALGNITTDDQADRITHRPTLPLMPLLASLILPLLHPF